jgi:hypothetical protein
VRNQSHLPLAFAQRTLRPANSCQKATVKQKHRQTQMTGTLMAKNTEQAPVTRGGSPVALDPRIPRGFVTLSKKVMFN